MVHLRKLTRKQQSRPRDGDPSESIETGEDDGAHADCAHTKSWCRYEIEKRNEKIANLEAEVGDHNEGKKIVENQYLELRKLYQQQQETIQQQRQKIQRLKTRLGPKRG